MSLESIVLKFNNTNTETYNVLKNDEVSVISYNLVISDDEYESNVGRIQLKMDKYKRDCSFLKIAMIEYEYGKAIIHYDTDSVSDSYINYLKRDDVRIFINALTVENKITAITGFTVAIVR